MSELLNIRKVLDSAPIGASEYCYYDYGECTELTYLNCENQFYDETERRWVDMSLVDNYFHSRHNLKDIETIMNLKQENADLKASLDSVKAEGLLEAADNFQMVHEFTDGVSTDEYTISWFKNYAKNPNPRQRQQRG